MKKRLKENFSHFLSRASISLFILLPFTSFSGYTHNRGKAAPGRYAEKYTFDY